MRPTKCCRHFMYILIRASVALYITSMPNILATAPRTFSMQASKACVVDLHYCDLQCSKVTVRVTLRRLEQGVFLEISVTRGLQTCFNNSTEKVFFSRTFDHCLHFFFFQTNRQTFTLQEYIVL